MLAIEKLVDLVNRYDVWHVPDLVIEPCQVDVKLVVIIVAEHLQHGFVQLIFLHYGSDHVAVDELIYLFDGHIHPVVGGNVPFQL